ncbi:hypothetical protein DYB37_014085 [Aphanomyces astaci]|uniref:HSF-type DNA-binding domain-containing protein n=1 Tax=Aphanomyces astaci TaxID=112090 RepID=A0A3R6XRD9_APHAT|nr:hypothetical protein DYB35_013985 [Aphanomyces astaci]RHZ09410.1 hypothetical protein DYB37_014085 [Aphanomyces astaci]
MSSLHATCMARRSPSGAKFVKKLFDMMSMTPPSVGGWCRDGSAIEIKCPVDFAQLMLPKYFKHSKFSSFVRQLNFYGFQTCKSDVLLIAHESQHKALVFRHPHFNQHKPHLMTKIKRKTNFSEICDTVDEVEELRHDVSDIKATLVALSTQLTQLTQMITSVQQKPPSVSCHPLQIRDSLIEALEFLTDDNASADQLQDSSALAPFYVQCDGVDAATVYQC